jgi:hypothetical protein
VVTRRRSLSKIWRGATDNPHGRWVAPALLDIGSDEVLKAAEARLRGA